MANKLDERFPYKFSRSTLRRYEVSETEKWKHEANCHGDEKLADNVTPPKSW